MIHFNAVIYTAPVGSDGMYDCICNIEIAENTGLPPLMDLIIRRRNSLFGHVARLGKDTPAHPALQRQIDIFLGRLPNCTWKMSPGHPRSKWLDQIRSDNILPQCDLLIYRNVLSIEVTHSGVTQRSQPTMQ